MIFTKCTCGRECKFSYQEAVRTMTWEKGASEYFTWVCECGQIYMKKAAKPIIL